MKKQIIKQLSEIIESTTILSPAEFSFDGKILSYPVPAAVDPTAAAAQNPLIEQLQKCFYQYCYVQPFNGGAPALETAQVEPNAKLVEQLSAANDTQERWETGWRIAEMLPSGQIKAEKYGRTRVLWAGEFISRFGFGVAPQIGAEISVFFPKESTVLQPGFFFAFSQTFIDQADDYNLMRFYWNIQEKGAPDLLRSISAALNRFEVPYRFKCLNNQLPFNRTDSAVLFLNKRFYRVVAELMPDIYDEVRHFLGAETPLFSKQLAPGLGLAEDPNNGDSFGMSRCRVLAEGIWSGYAKNLQTAAARLDEVVGQFEVYGIDLERPYLNGRAADQYLVPEFKHEHSLAAVSE
jgi:hypothetical protein